jgi:hypothetical protein
MSRPAERSSVDYHIAIDGQIEGPLPEAEVRARIADGRLRAVDHCWAEGWSDWRPVHEVFPEVVASPAAARPPGWEQEATRPPNRLPRLPARRDHTSGALFLALGSLAAVVLVIGLIWFFTWGPAKPEDPGPRPVSRGKLEAERRAAPDGGGRTGPELRERLFSGTNLEQIAQACLAYAKAHDGNLPTFSDDIRPFFGDRFEAAMDVPETPERESRGYVLRMELNNKMPPSTIIAFEARPRADGTRAVAYMSGKVGVVSADDPELKRAMGQ